MSALRMAWRQLRRDAAAGEVRILFAALTLAVFAITLIGFITDRAERALALEANALLAGDVIVRGDAPIEGPVRAAAGAEGLRHAETRELQSMIRVVGEDDARLQLGALRAVGEGFPLRGHFRIVEADAQGRMMPEREVAHGPAQGTAWLTRAGAERLGASLGDVLAIGDSELKLTALVTREPDATTDPFNFAPRAFLHLDDLEPTGLVQEGSRIRYRLVVAGDEGDVKAFIETARPALGRGQRMETVADGRPEIRSSLQRASRFLGLAGLVSVILASVAVAMSARRHTERHLSGAAVMRCLGASQRTLVAVNLGALGMLGVLASATGILLALGVQWLATGLLQQALDVEVPRPDWRPAAGGFGVGMVVLLAFACPPVLALRRVPALRVLRRDLDFKEPSAWLVTLVGVGAFAGLLWWKAGSAVLGGAVLLGLAATFAVLAALAWTLVWLLRRVRSRLRGSLRYGLANVSRRPATSIAQVSSLGLGMMALLLLTFVRTDLLDRWQRAVSAEAPNRFIFNVQEEQLEPLRAFMAEQRLAPPALYPMIRGRLQAHNGARVTRPPADLSQNTDVSEESAEVDEETKRARRRAERQYNLSFTDTLRPDNEVTAGRFWGGQRPARPELSIEEDYAESMGWKLGDRLAFDIAGQVFEGTVTSLRKVNWESFEPNFFVLASPGALDGYPASYITAVRVPNEGTRFSARLVERFPNVSVVDVDAVLAQVRRTADQVSIVVEVVFYFSLFAGLLVLMAAVSASQDERLLEGSVMRVLGGSRAQLRLAQASEFAALGLLAGLTAALSASVLAGIVSTRVLDLPWTMNWAMAGVGAASGAFAALLAGLFATRRVLEAPPSVTLRAIGG